MAQARHDIIANQSQFYRDGFRKIVGLIFVLLILAYALLALILYVHITRPNPHYFISTSSGRLVEILPIERIPPTPVAPPPPVVRTAPAPAPAAPTTP